MHGLGSETFLFAKLQHFCGEKNSSLTQTESNLILINFSINATRVKLMLVTMSGSNLLRSRTVYLVLSSFILFNVASTLVMAIQMKAIEQYFHVVQFIILYKVAQTLKSVDKALVREHQMKAIEQYFHVVQSIMLSVDKARVCDHSNTFMC